MTQTIEQLTARVRELEADRDQWMGDCKTFHREMEKREQQILSLQAYAEQLRSLIPARTPGGFVTLGKNYMEAEDKFNDPYSKMCKFKRVYLDKCEKALSISRDTSALDAYVAEKVKEVKE